MNELIRRYRICKIKGNTSTRRGIPATHHKTKQIFWGLVVVIFMLMMFGCGELKEMDEANKKARAELAHVKNTPKRMELIFENLRGSMAVNYYGLRDKNTGREYLIVLTGSRDGGVTIMELKRNNEREYRD